MDKEKVKCTPALASVLTLSLSSVPTAALLYLSLFAAPAFTGEPSASLAGGVWHCTSFVTVAPGAGQGGGEQNPFDLKFNSDGTYSFVGMDVDPEQLPLRWRQEGSNIEIDHVHDYHSTESGAVTSPTHASFSHEYIPGYTTTDTCDRQGAPLEQAASTTTTEQNGGAAAPVRPQSREMHNECARRIIVDRPYVGTDGATTPHRFKELKNVCDQTIRVTLCMSSARIPCWKCGEFPVDPGKVTYNPILGQGGQCSRARCSDIRIAYNAVLEPASEDPPTPVHGPMCQANPTK